MSYTPGPWRVDETAALGAYGVWADWSLNPSGQSQVCSVYHGNKSDFTREMRDANAMLIASAPYMLKALEFAHERLMVMLDADEATVADQECLLEIEAAIAKATGK